MAENGPFSVRIDDDLETDIEDYAESHNISKGKALTKFAERGRQEFGYAGGQNKTVVEEVASQLFQIGFILGLAFLLLTFIAPLPFLFFAAAGSISVAGVSHIVVWMEPRLTENLYQNAHADTDDIAARGDA